MTMSRVRSCGNECIGTDHHQSYIITFVHHLMISTGFLIWSTIFQYQRKQCDILSRVRQWSNTCKLVVLYIKSISISYYRMITQHDHYDVCIGPCIELFIPYFSVIMFLKQEYLLDSSNRHRAWSPRGIFKCIFARLSCWAGGIL